MPDDFALEEYDEEEMAASSSWCDHCHNTGYLNCHCGGDLCVCELNGEYPCPYCDL